MTRVSTARHRCSGSGASEALHHSGAIQSFQDQGWSLIAQQKGALQHVISRNNGCSASPPASHDREGTEPEPMPTQQASNSSIGNRCTTALRLHQRIKTLLPAGGFGHAPQIFSGGTVCFHKESC